VFLRGIEGSLKGVFGSRNWVKTFSFTFFERWNDSFDVSSVQTVEIEQTEELAHVVEVNPVVNTFLSPVATTS